ncbi:hypothetical protein M2419_000890 [Sphingobacterium sp. BIGb0116]|nr:hypothetical protein [Sphingobacterium sp. BIGb0116]
MQISCFTTFLKLIYNKNYIHQTLNTTKYYTYSNSLFLQLLVNLLNKTVNYCKTGIPFIHFKYKVICRINY